MSGVVAEVFGAAFRPRTSGWVRPRVRPGPGYRIGERSVVRLSRAVARGARWWESLHSGPTRMRSGRGGAVVRRGFGRGSAGARNQIRMGYMPRRGCRCTNLDRFEILVGRVSTGYVRSCLKRVACWGRQPGGAGRPVSPNIGIFLRFAKFPARSARFSSVRTSSRGAALPKRRRKSRNISYLCPRSVPRRPCACRRFRQIRKGATDE